MLDLFEGNICINRFGKFQVLTLGTSAPALAWVWTVSPGRRRRASPRGEVGAMLGLAFSTWSKSCGSFSLKAAAPLGSVCKQGVYKLRWRHRQLWLVQRGFPARVEPVQAFLPKPVKQRRFRVCSYISTNIYTKKPERCPSCQPESLPNQPFVGSTNPICKEVIVGHKWILTLLQVQCNKDKITCPGFDLLQVHPSP